MHENDKLDLQQAIDILRSATGPLLTTIGHSQNKKLYDLLMSSVEHALVKYALEMEETQAAAAGLLGISRNTLRRKMEKYKLRGRRHHITGNESAEAEP